MSICVNFTQFIETTIYKKENHSFTAKKYISFMTCKLYLGFGQVKGVLGHFISLRPSLLSHAVDNNDV